MMSWGNLYLESAFQPQERQRYNPFLEGEAQIRSHQSRIQLQQHQMFSSRIFHVVP